jgi:DNA-binding Lrp family transcriptional regulator
MQELDDLDRRLIGALREDARMPITRLADVLKVSRTTAQARLDRLLESGAVLGFTIRARSSGDALRAIQTGRAQDYVYGLAVGVLFLLFWVRWAL